MTSEALIAKFQEALDDHWGYIWGAAGIMWTKSRQKQKVDYMVAKYGTSWQKNSEAKQDNYYSAAMYGEKWIGHTVADCSGLFVWAYRQLGASIAHGSNMIYDGYVSPKGKLNDALKKTLLPGTAVFTGDEKKHGHIGLYVGNGKVIEASGTQAGVCTSNLSAGKWTYYGQLKAVQYGEAPDQDFHLTIKRGSKGDPVRDLQKILKLLGYDLGPYGVDGDFGKCTEAAVKAFQRDHGLTEDGICGEKTWKALEEATLGDRYTITIRSLTKAQADALAKSYPNSTIVKE